MSTAHLGMYYVTATFLDDTSERTRRVLEGTAPCWIRETTSGIVKALALFDKRLSDKDRAELLTVTIRWAGERADNSKRVIPDAGTEGWVLSPAAANYHWIAATEDGLTGEFTDATDRSGQHFQGLALTIRKATEMREESYISSGGMSGLTCGRYTLSIDEAIHKVTDNSHERELAMLLTSQGYSEMWDWANRCLDGRAAHPGDARDARWGCGKVEVVDEPTDKLAGLSNYERARGRSIRS